MKVQFHAQQNRPPVSIACVILETVERLNYKNSNLQYLLYDSFLEEDCGSNRFSLLRKMRKNENLVSNIYINKVSESLYQIIAIYNT